MRINLLTAALLAFSAPLSEAAAIHVTVTNVRNDRGLVRVAICTQAQFLKPNCPWHGKASAIAGSTVVTIDGVPPGTYAAQAFHDENGTGVLERNFLGLPREGMGFSNNAPMHFGPPRFDAAAFPVTTSGAAISFSLRYY